MGLTFKKMPGRIFPEYFEGFNKVFCEYGDFH